MRLLKPIEFQHTFAQGKRYRCRFFTVTARVNELKHPRLGLAISRKHAPRAVERNRIKRVVRESFRCNATRMGPVDIVVQATATARSESSDVLSRKLEVLWSKLE
ncbi:MAG: ribonuclease P protein component [Gammaproteobacteria bacterium]|jgi:ribonuclease P protein component|nr:ribonuclease P protein component [Gammaproteobacteria bacterium]